ncbi:unnamed protein product [Paramecium sonneborni]|uniref:AB hydrolase-1 domain-containing protein n=1 Tax=Paramecium sonneborni TaxID=65129 RepID=A0A8S1RG18_9CILI|nr:unnamed protein product [Paramecium sonneborni]
MFCCIKRESLEESKKHKRLNKEIQVLQYYGLKIGINYCLFDFNVEYLGKTYLIHTFSGGHNNKEILILLHGYGGSNLHYSKIYGEIIKKFKVYSIDLPGMGYSSKQDIKIDFFEEAMEFFIGTISKLIMELYPQQKVTLIGHSFGGFVAAHLLVRFPNLLKRLILLSPAGSTQYTYQQIIQMQDFSQFPFWKRLIIKHVQVKWQGVFAIPQYLNNSFIGRQLIKYYLKNRMHLQGDEYTLWKSYIDEMLELPEGSEKSICLFFHFPAFAKNLNSIETILSQNHYQISNIPISFYYGYYDWMDNQGAINLTIYQNIKIKIINDAGHQLNFENPQGLKYRILMNLFKKNLKQSNTKKKRFYRNLLSIYSALAYYFIRKFHISCHSYKQAILPQIKVDQSNESIKYLKFEPYMIQGLIQKSNQYEYDPDYKYIQLDEKKKGYSQIHKLKQKLIWSNYQNHSILQNLIQIIKNRRFYQISYKQISKEQLFFILLLNLLSIIKITILF